MIFNPHPPPPPLPTLHVGARPQSQMVDEHAFDSLAHIKKWYAKCQQEIDNYQELNRDGAEMFSQMAKPALMKLRAN